MDPRLILLILMLASMVTMLAFALSGPSANKVQLRRLASITGRHSPSVNNVVEARMRKAIATYSQPQSSLLVSLIPNPENLTKRLRMTGKKWTLHQFMMV